MSNVIPPLVSSSPPPMEIEDDEDDFGDFTMANDFSYDGFSLPTTPQHSSSNSQAYHNNSDISFTPVDMVDGTKGTFLTELADVKDNTSQDSVASTITSDSGMSSERIFSSGDDSSSTLDPKPNNVEKTTNLELPKSMDYLENNEKDYLDVRNVEVKYDSSGENISEKHIPFQLYDLEESSPVVVENITEENCVNVELNLHNVEINLKSEDIPCESTCSNNLPEEVLAIKDYKDKRKVEMEIKWSIAENVYDNTVNSTIEENCEIKDEDVRITENTETCELENTCTFDDGIIENNLSIEEGCDYNDEFTSFSSSKIDGCETSTILTKNCQVYESKMSEENALNVLVESCEKIDNDTVESDEEFANFESATISPDAMHEEKISVNNNSESTDDEFGDFSEFPVQREFVVDSVKSNTQERAYTRSVSAETSIIDDTNLEIINLFSKKSNRSDSAVLSNKIKEVFRNTFPSDIEDVSSSISGWSATDLQNCDMWHRLEDIENSKAMTYRWENSKLYNTYLKVLNMDTRNILYGSNLNMPRFASNLGGTPLEPLKPVQANPPTSCSPPVVTNNDSQNVDTPTEKDFETISTAQFDWNDSGLINPLDFSQNNTMLLDLGLVNSFGNISAHISHEAGTATVDDATQMTCPIADIDTWKYWTHCSLSKKTENQENKNNEVDSNVTTIEDLNVQSEEQSHSKFVSSLQLPDLSLGIENFLPEDNSKIQKNLDDGDEFTTFHSSSVLNENSWKSDSFSGVKLRETHISASHDLNANQHDNETNNPAWLQPTILTPKLTRKLEIDDAVHKINSTIQKESDTSKNIDHEDEDEFSDFQYVPISKLPENTSPNIDTTIPVVEKTTVKMRVETLQPVVIEPAISSQSHLEINWPDPGISSDDFDRLNSISFTPKTDQPHIYNNIQKDVLVTQSEDDWSEFVSVQNCTTRKIESNSVHQNTQKPNEPLCQSINQWNMQIQKVITEPSVCVSSFTNDAPASLQTNTNAMSKPFQFLETALKPSLSNLQPNSYSYANPTDVKNCTTIQPNTKSHSHVQDVIHSTDDDWSDFISNRDDVQHYSNGWIVQNNQLPERSKISGWNQPPNFTSWNAPSAFTPNIITNPAHFDQRSSHTKQFYQASVQNKNNTTTQLKPVCVTTTTVKNQTLTTLQAMGGKNSVATISTLPELDFMTPKSVIRSKHSKK